MLVETSYGLLRRIEGKLVYSKDPSINIWTYHAKTRWKEPFLIVKVIEGDEPSSFVIDVLTKQGLFQIRMGYNTDWNKYCWVKDELEEVE